MIFNFADLLFLILFIYYTLVSNICEKFEYLSGRQISTTALQYNVSDISKMVMQLFIYLTQDVIKDIYYFMTHVKF